MNGGFIEQWMSRGAIVLAFLCLSTVQAFSDDYAIYTLEDLQGMPNHLSDRCLFMNDAGETAADILFLL